MSKLVVIGGSKGLGAALLNKLLKKYNECVVFDIAEPLILDKKIKYIECDISKDIQNCFNEIKEADCLIVTAGVGIAKPFENISIEEIKKIYSVNTVATVELIKLFYSSLLSENNKKMMVISSIAGEVSSPLFSVYGSSKAAVSKLCESLNIELEKSKSNNRITCVIAVSFAGTSFNGLDTNINELDDISDKCIDAMEQKKGLVFINEPLCKDIINRYYNDRHSFGLSSYEYKIQGNRISNRKMIVVGYLSGTFDLFHIGHLNLLKRAKQQCDYLIVGVHKSGSWKGKETFIPFEERLEIIKSCKYVDEAHVSFDEDSDAWDLYHYDKLFVGSDYKGTERFNRYEDFFKDKGVKIIYFPYTKGTSSTQLREKLSSNRKK